MRRLTAWIGGALGGVALYRLARRRLGGSPPEPAVADGPDDRAEELRAKLDEIRESDAPSPAEPGEPEESVEERRRRVHEEGRAALDEMQEE